MVQDAKKWNLGIAKLGALMVHCPLDVDEGDVVQFHEIVALLEEASGEDFSTFRIPSQKLAVRATSMQPGGFRMGRGSVTYSDKKYCDSRYFRGQLHGLANFVTILQSTSAKNRAPANPFELFTDDQLKEMLLERSIKPKKSNGVYGFERANAIAQLVNYEKPEGSGPPTPSTVINFQDVHGSNFNLHSPGASITQTNNYRSDDFRELLNKLKEFATSKDSSHDQRELMNVDVHTIEVQIDSPQPKASIVKECLLSAKAILESAAGSVLAAEILVHLQRYLS